MPQLPVYNLKKEEVGKVDLSDGVFGGEVRPHLMNAAVRAQIAWRYEMRTANSKTRSEVHGTTKKTYRQKGTGQARHGAVTAPIFVGGGKAHGPKPHRRRYKINKKVMRAALISALSQQQREDRLFVVDKMELDKASTKQAAAGLKAFASDSVLVVNGNKEEKEQFFNRSLTNLPKVKFIQAAGVNVFDLLKYKNVVFSQKAAQELTERLSNA